MLLVFPSLQYLLPPTNKFPWFHLIWFFLFVFSLDPFIFLSSLLLFYVCTQNLKKQKPKKTSEISTTYKKKNRPVFVSFFFFLFPFQLFFFCAMGNNYTACGWWWLCALARVMFVRDWYTYKNIGPIKWSAVTVARWNSFDYKVEKSWDIYQPSKC